MKKIFNFSFLILMTLTIISCEEDRLGRFYIVGKPEIFKGTELYKAAQLIYDGDENELESELKNKNVNLLITKDSTYSVSLINWAAIIGNFDAVDKLLDLGANPNPNIECLGYKRSILQVLIFELDRRYFVLKKSLNRDRIKKLITKLMNKGYDRRKIQCFYDLSSDTCSTGKISISDYSSSSDLDIYLAILILSVEDYTFLEQYIDYKYINCKIHYTYLDLALPITATHYFDDGDMDILHYLLVIKKPKLNSEFNFRIFNYYDKDVYGNNKKISDTLSLTKELRNLDYNLSSKEHKLKMEIVEYLKTQGIDYWAEPVSNKINEKYKSDPEFLRKY